MSIDPLRELQDTITRGDIAAIHKAVAQLPADTLPEARKLAARLGESAAADEAIRRIEDRADELGVALSA